MRHRAAPIPASTAGRPPAGARVAAAVAVPDNILLADWTGPYDGVPPWDQVKPELFREALQFAIDEQRARDRGDRQQSRAADLRQHHRGDGEGRPAARPGAVDLRRDDQQSVDARISGARQGMAAQAVGGVRRDHARSQAVPAHQDALRRARHARPRRRADCACSTRTYDSFVRNGAKLDPAQKAAAEPAINQQLASAFSDFNARLLADEGTYTAANAGRDEGRAAGRQRCRAGGGQGQGPAGRHVTRSATPARRSSRC